ncbi:hypothetical protein COD67_01810 [Bacillus cereus]|uniref:hypothetical protein n=1 Tax=Bacillus wiedmannii TaxID=1890302 RepID=UPI0007DB0352|nr:hypothetical protein [Bacillus wiedmannii]MDA1526338.1 hypothetical protein [Bacillus cereus]OAK33681.1 hypothetical protein A6286_16550 [Bacillus wiedmannii]PFJ17575.1 hypothetical protein COI89_06475 [Bacillus cereus]PGU70825.1 hypothetical protein COD67_01810 [Bacillus cereus]
MNITLSEDQFSISIGMSEAEILNIEYHDDNLIISAQNVELLCDFHYMKFYSPQISYDEWLNLKYTSDQFHEENLDHINFFDQVTFVIPNPRIYYEGLQHQFIDILGNFEIKNYDSYPYSYIFGGTIEHSNHDEFEVCSNQYIQFYYDDEKLEDEINKHLLGYSRNADKIHFDTERELKRQKLSRKNTSSESKLLELNF